MALLPKIVLCVCLSRKLLSCDVHHVCTRVCHLVPYLCCGVPYVSLKCDCCNCPVSYFVFTHKIKLQSGDTPTFSVTYTNRKILTNALGIPKAKCQDVVVQKRRLFI